jgi:hypothetical protein
MSTTAFPLEAEQDMPEAATLACEIATAIGMSVTTEHDSATNEYLNADGAWEYHFATDPAWGFVVAGADGPITTTYDGSPYGDWRKLTLDPYQWCLFCDDAPVAVVSPTETTVGGPKALETAMIDALRTEREALRGADGDAQ